MATEGQVWTYNYSGNNVTFSVPDDGRYQIYCYGSQGSTGAGGAGCYDGGGSGAAGANGDLCASIAEIPKGIGLVLHVGGMSWNDGGAGSNNSKANNTEFGGGGYHKSWAKGGNGGGSSYILYNSTKIISARGGNGGYGYGSCPRDASCSAPGGAGGGSNQIVNTQGITWDLAALNNRQSSINAGNGRIVITLLKKSKMIFYNSIKINQLFYNGTEMENVYFNGIQL